MCRVYLINLIRAKALLFMAFVLMFAVSWKGLEGISSGDGSILTDASTTVGLLFLAPLLSAILGSELASPMGGSWPWLLARPMSRLSILMHRWMVDMGTIGVFLAVVLLVVGLSPTVPVEEWGLVLVLCLTAHGAGALSSAFTPSPLRAFLNGVSITMGAMLLAAAAVLIGIRIGANFSAGTDQLFQLSPIFPPVPYQLDPRWLTWPTYAALLQGCVLAVLGWMVARHHLRRVPLEERSRTRLWWSLPPILFLFWATTGATAFQLSGAVVSRFDFLGVLSDGTAFFVQHSSLGGKRLIRANEAGTLIWRSTDQSGCSKADLRADLLAIQCVGETLLFEAFQESPRRLTLDTDEGPLASHLSPDGHRLATLAPNGNLQIVSVDDGHTIAMVRLESDSAFPAKFLLWGADSLMRVQQLIRGTWRISLVDDEGGVVSVRNLPRVERLDISGHRVQDSLSLIHFSGRILDDTAGRPHPIHLLLLADGRLARVRSPDGLKLRPAGISSAGFFFVTAPDEQTLNLWLAAPPDSTAGTEGLESAHSADMVGLGRLAIDPDGLGAGAGSGRLREVAPAPELLADYEDLLITPTLMGTLTSDQFNTKHRVQFYEDPDGAGLFLLTRRSDARRQIGALARGHYSIAMDFRPGWVVTDSLSQALVVSRPGDFPASTLSVDQERRSPFELIRLPWPEVPPFEE